MTLESAVQAVVGFLGGGVTGGLIALWGAARMERIARRKQYVRQQLESLYGPLHFYALQNENLFELSRQIMDAAATEYSGRQLARDSHTQETVRQELGATIDLSNQYVRDAVHNNDRIVELLDRSFAYVHVNDVKAFAEFVLDYRRYKSEYAEDSREVPWRILSRLGEVSFMRPAFIELVRNRFEQLKTELD